MTVATRLGAQIIPDERVVKRVTTKSLLCRENPELALALEGRSTYFVTDPNVASASKAAIEEYCSFNDVELAGLFSSGLWSARRRSTQ